MTGTFTGAVSWSASMGPFHWQLAFPTAWRLVPDKWPLARAGGIWIRVWTLAQKYMASFLQLCSSEAAHYSWPLFKGRGTEEAVGLF